VLLALLTGACLLISGCATQRPLSPAEQVTIGFHDLLPEAATNFCNNVHNDYDVLQERIDTGVDEMQPSLDELVDEFDGYIDRVRQGVDAPELHLKNVDSDQVKIQQWLEGQFERFLIPAINQFYESYTNDVADFESRLLVHTYLDDWVNDLSKQMIAQATNTVFQGNANDLKGSTGAKVASDAFGFVPFVGDAYDLFTAFIYDPRMARIKNHAHEYLPKLRSQLHQRFLDPLVQQLPRPEEVQVECGKQFSARKALKILTLERP
jgi:hypothetical protein